MAPDGASPVELDVRQPVRRLHQRRAAAHGGVGESHAVGAGAEAKLLVFAHGIIILQCRSTCCSPTCSCRRTLPPRYAQFAVPPWQSGWPAALGGASRREAPSSGWGGASACRSRAPAPASGSPAEAPNHTRRG